MRVQYDFTAPTGTHFGIVKTVAERLAEIASPVDYWDAAHARYTLVEGKVSEWAGALGRKFTQPLAARRPLPSVSDGLAFYDAATSAAYNFLTLSGAQIGQVSAFTVAFSAQLRPSALTKDAQYIFGNGAATFRLAYRYVSERAYLRMAVGSAQMDVDLPSGHQGKVGGVVTVAPSEVWLHVNGSSSLRLATTDGAAMTALAVGGSATNAGTWDGWGKRYGFWTKTATADEVALLQAWTA